MSQIAETLNTPIEPLFDLVHVSYGSFIRGVTLVPGT